MTSANVCVYRERHFGARGLSTLNYLSRYAQARGLRPAWRLAFKVARRPGRFADWLTELENYRTRFALSDAGLHSYAIAPLRPFLRAGLNFEQRLQIARSHHALVGDVLATGLIRNIWANDQTLLGVVSGRRGASFALWLAAAEYPREGALQIMIARNSDGGSAPVPLARITFSLAEIPETGHRRTLLVGGLQGGRPTLGKRAIIEATRDMRGLRPKAAVILAAQSFAANAGCSDVLAVSDESHIINLQTKDSLRRKAAKYDAFWLERGGSPGGFLGFALPGAGADVRPERKAVSDSVRSAFSARPAQSICSQTLKMNFLTR